MTDIRESREEERARRTREIVKSDRQFSARSVEGRRSARNRAALWFLWTQAAGGGKRFFDIGVSGIALLILSPLLLFLYTMNLKKGGSLLRSPKLGRWACQFSQYSFSTGRLRKLPSLMNVWLGDMSIIGPRPVPPGALASPGRITWRRFDIRPGMFCLWWMRVRANVAYGTEDLADAEYVDTHDLLGDVGIALRAVPASMLGGAAESAPRHIDLLGIPIDNLTMEEAVADILLKCHSTTPSQVCFVNADCVNLAKLDQAYASILNTCGMVLADGIGVRLAGKLLNRNIRQNVNGTDMLPVLCSALANDGLGVYLLGGQPGVAIDVGNWMKQSFPALRVCGHQHGYFTPEQVPEVLARVRASGARLLLVAFGVPRQEVWIREHLAETGAAVSIGVGGLFDFYSGRMPRAPAWMRELGTEWLYRFWQEPGRMWRRYFVGNLVFIARVLRERYRTEVSG